MPDLVIFQVPGNDAGHLSAIGHDSIGDLAHQADTAAAIDQPDAAPGHFLAKIGRNFSETGRLPKSRTAINAYRFGQCHFLETVLFSLYLKTLERDCCRGK